MAAYTNEASLLKRIGAARLLTLTDRDRDGTADTGVLDDAIAMAGSTIRLELRQRFGSNVDSIADIAADPATPAEIQRVAEELVLADLYSWYEPGGRDHEYHRARAERWLEGLRAGELDLSIGRAAAHEGRTVAVYDAEDPSFAGLDSSDLSRTRGI